MKQTMMSSYDIEEIFKRGPALVLENDACMGDYLYAEELKQMMDNKPIDFVFMATCHS